MYNDIDIIMCFISGIAIGAVITSIIACTNASKLFKRNKKKKTNELVKRIHIHIIKDCYDN